MTFAARLEKRYKSNRGFFHIKTHFPDQLFGQSGFSPYLCAVIRNNGLYT